MSWLHYLAPASYCTATSPGIPEEVERELSEQLTRKSQEVWRYVANEFDLGSDWADWQVEKGLRRVCLENTADGPIGSVTNSFHTAVPAPRSSDTPAYFTLVLTTEDFNSLGLFYGDTWLERLENAYPEINALEAISKGIDVPPDVLIDLAELTPWPVEVMEFLRTLFRSHGMEA